MEDIQQYLDGTMSDAARRQFEALLVEDERLRTELELHTGMRQLRLEQRVGKVSIARQQDQKNRVRRTFIIGIIIVALIGFALFMAYNSAENSRSTPATPNTQQPVPPAMEHRSPAPSTQSTDQSLQRNRPMAQNQSPTANNMERPQLRGVYADLDPATRQILDTLLLLTQAQTSTVSKTPLWQKAVQNLASGQVEAAKSAVMTLEKSDAAEATWLLALTLLAQGKVEDAAVIFQKISRISGHPKQVLARQALAKLK